MRQELIYKDLSYEITGLLFEVHNELGRFCNEKQCADLFEQKLIENKIKYKREYVIPKSFSEEKPGRNRIDFLIDNKIIIEFKCSRFVDKKAYYQTIRYLEASNIKLGIIVNFRNKHLKPKRILNPNYK